MSMNKLRSLIIKKGEKFPKKHGDWYRINVYDNYYLVLDTWNGHIDIHKGECKPSDLNNMYRVVYAFSDRIGYIMEHMVNFWYAHVNQAQ